MLTQHFPTYTAISPAIDFALLVQTPSTPCLSPFANDNIMVSGVPTMNSRWEVAVVRMRSTTGAYY